MLYCRLGDGEPPEIFRRFRVLVGMPMVFVISKDWTLRVAMRAELLHEGIEALGMESADDAARVLAEGTAPSAIVLDAAEGAASTARAALSHLAKRVPVVVVASRTESAPPIEGAAALVYRPVRVGEIVARVKQLLAGQAA
jgi:DNA-binding response OmpR family regulator